MPQAIPAVLAALQTAANFVIGASASATFAVTGSAAAAAAVSNFVAGAVTLGAAGTGIAGAAGAMVGTAALSGAISAMAPKPPVARAQLQTTAGTLGPRKWVVGRCGLGGHSLTPTPMQSASGKIATVAYAVGGVGPVGPLEGLWFGDDFVTFDGSGIASGKWSAALGCVSNEGSWSNTALTLPSNHPTEWTSAHRGDGCGMALFWIRTEAKEFQRNSPQTPRFLRQGSAAYVLDPRTGSQATYASGGFNRACVAYTFCRGIYRNGQLIMGLGLSDAEIDLPAYQYWATVCDTNGWRLAGEISAGDDRNETLKAICFGGGAIPVTRAGKESVIVSAPGVSVATITDDDWIDLPLLESKVETFALPNTIIPRFSHEPARFDIVDGSQVAPAQWLTDDGGIERTATVEVPWCTWATQAAQIAAYGGYNDREPLKLTGRLKASRRYDVFPGDCFTWQSAELGTSIKFKMVGVTAIGEDLSITILAETETDAKHALALGTTTTPEPRQALPPFDPAAVATPASGIWSLAAAQITSGGTNLPILRVSRSAGELDTLVTQVIVRHRLNGSTAWLSEYLLDASALSVEIGEVTPGTAYQVGVWYVNANGATSTSPRILGPVTSGTFVAGASASPGGGGSLIVDPLFARQSDAFTWVPFTLTPVTNTRVQTSSGMWVWRMAFGASPAAGTYAGFFGGLNNRFAVRPGDRIQVAAEVGGDLAFAYMHAFWLDASGLIISTEGGNATSVGPGGTGAMSNYTRVGAIVTAPAGAATVTFGVYAYPTPGAAAANAWIGQPWLAFARPEQTQISDWSPGFQGQPGADVTLQNVSAAVVGQGPLAISPLTEAQVRGRFLGEFATEAAAITAGLQDGDTWRRSSDGAQLGRVGGVSLAVALPQLSANASAYAVSGTRSTAGSVTTGSVTVTAAGGLAPYTYEWNLVGGVASTASAANAATTTFTGTADPAPAVSTWQCTVTDADGAVAHVLIRAAFVLTS